MAGLLTSRGNPQLSRSCGRDICSNGTVSCRSLDNGGRDGLSVSTDVLLASELSNGEVVRWQ